MNPKHFIPRISLLLILLLSQLTASAPGFAGVPLAPHQPVVVVPSVLTASQPQNTQLTYNLPVQNPSSTPVSWTVLPTQIPAAPVSAGLPAWPELQTDPQPARASTSLTGSDLTDPLPQQEAPAQPPGPVEYPPQDGAPSGSLEDDFPGWQSRPPAPSQAEAVSSTKLVYFPSRSIFNLLNPGLPVETLEAGLWAAGELRPCPAPWDASTNNSCFAPGGLLPGIRLQDSPLNGLGGGAPNGLAGVGQGWNGSLSKSAVSYFYADGFEVVFDPPVHAAGMDLVHFPSNNIQVAIQVFSASNDLLGTTQALATNAGSFWGIYSAEPIARIHILSPLNSMDGMEGVDNIAFGQGVVNTYGDRSQFDAQFPGLPLEDFENGQWGDGGFKSCPAPWDASTNNACFAPGGLLPGVSFQDDPLNELGGGTTNGLTGLGNGTLGNLTKGIVASSFVDAFEIRFDPPVNVAGMDLLHFYSNNISVAITVYDTVGNLLVTTSANAGNTGSFWGIYSQVPITRIRINSPLVIADGSEGVDNLAFGRVSQGGIKYYLQRGAFDGDNPGLPLEDFEKSLVADGMVIGCPAPWDAATSSACLPLGGLLPGIRFQDDPLNDLNGANPAGLAALGKNFGGSLSKVIVANSFVDAFEIHFDPPVHAAGMDLVNYFTNQVPLQLYIYDAQGGLLDAPLASASNAGTFWGVYSLAPISRIRIHHPISGSDGAEGVDNLAFGQGGSCALPVEIPWMSIQPSSGVIPPNSSANLSVVLDSTGLAPGIYTANICLETSDPAFPRVSVPVELSVFEPPTEYRIFTPLLSRKP
jgi:hypothetical protein